MSVASVILASLLLAIPATLAVAAIVCGLPATRMALSEGQRWRVAWGAVQLVAVLVGALVILSLQHLNAPLLWLSDDPLRLTLLVLLSVMALVLVLVKYGTYVTMVKSLAWLLVLSSLASMLDRLRLRRVAG